MKKSIIIPTIILLSAITFQTHAQSNEIAVRSEIKETKTEEKGLRKEKRKERTALRKLEGKEVGLASKYSFTNDFGNIKPVQWKRTIYFDEAVFMQNKQLVTAFYDSNSKLVGTTMKSSFDKLPLIARKEIKEKYKDYKVEDVIFYDDNEENETDMIIYGIQFDDADNYFVELSKGDKKEVVKVDTSGEVYHFTTIK
ncbi:MAG: hypothetical protein ABI402_00785 [Ferruginibacter sp.]